MRTITLGYSPCPNDTFIFHAIVQGRIDTRGLSFREVLEDVETLNLMARRSELDVTKVSIHALGYLREDYCLLRSGGAFGRGCGPLVVAAGDLKIGDLRGKRIAIPGELTTAFLLLRLFDPDLGKNITVMPFHMIIEAVKTGSADAGLIIHESRFTYEKAGLRSLIDLGQWWEEATGLPIPLGGIIAKRSLGGDVIKNIERCIRDSVQHAFINRAASEEYIKSHAQETSGDVIKKHIDLYVNAFTLDIGVDGINAAAELFRQAETKGIMRRSPQSLLEDF